MLFINLREWTIVITKKLVHTSEGAYYMLILISVMNNGFRTRGPGKSSLCHPQITQSKGDTARACSQHRALPRAGDTGRDGNRGWQTQRYQNQKEEAKQQSPASLAPPPNNPAFAGVR